MSLHPEPIGEIPAETARIARAAFPRGTVVTELRDEFSDLYRDEDFKGRNVTVTSDTPDLRTLPGPCDRGFNDCVTSIRVRPVFARRFAISIFCSVGTNTPRLWMPSRVPTSRIVTRAGRLMGVPRRL